LDGFHFARWEVSVAQSALLRAEAEGGRLRFVVSPHDEALERMGQTQSYGGSSVGHPAT